MGLIREKSTEQTHQLEPEHLVGRTPVCALRLSERYISARHAVLRWNGDRWDIKDLGSRNGTFLDGVRLIAGEEYAVKKGSVIAFGKPEQAWVLADPAAPAVMAVPFHGSEPVLIDGDLLTLPSSDDPQVTIFPNPEGGWLLEQPDESISPITNLQTFEIRGHVWKFCCPEHLCKTSIADGDYPPDLEVRHLELEFSVSRDEEHVQLHAVCCVRRFDLGTRAHNYLLLTLARRRLADAAEGLAETSCGWMYQEDLCHSISQTACQLNIDVCRIRKQFSAIGVFDAAGIIERRPRTRQLRIGTGRLSVVTL
jgi:hypothetical protein